MTAPSETPRWITYWVTLGCLTWVGLWMGMTLISMGLGILWLWRNV